MDRASFHDRFDLTDRVAIVTGGSRGIGLAIASGFAALGARVAVASRKADACEEAAAAIRAEGGHARAVPTHMGNLEQVRDLVTATVDEFGGVDIVVNNAANALAQPYGSITPEAFEKSYAVNLRGPVFLVQEALPHLSASEHAAIVNVVTAGVYTRAPYVSLYVAAKAAMVSMTRSMAAELVGRGIRANALAPGTVATDMVMNNAPPVRQAMVGAQLITRMADPDEMVPAAVFLVSDASSFMTGQVLVVDGGMTCH